MAKVSGRNRLAWVVGVTAGLESAQVAKVHLFFLAAVVFVIAARPVRLRWGALILAAALLLASTAFYGPLVNSKTTVAQIALLALAGALLAGTAKRGDIPPMLNGLLTIVTTAAGLALLQYLHILPSTPFHGENRPTGFIYREPDFLGLFSAVGAFLALRSTLRGPRRYAIMLLDAAAMLVSAARASWVAFTVAVGLLIVITVFTANRHARGTRPIRTVVVLAVIGVAVLGAVPSLRSQVYERIHTATTVDQSNTQASQSARERHQQAASLRAMAASAPWYGDGLTASGRVRESGQIQLSGVAKSNVASNWALGWWVDGKYVALPLIGLFILAALWRLRHTEGLLLVLVLVNNLYSNTSLIPITWFLLGLCLVEGRRSGRASQDRSARPSTALEWRSPQLGTSARPGR